MALDIDRSPVRRGRWAWLLGIALVAVGLGAAGCGDDESNGGSGPTGAGGATTGVGGAGGDTGGTGGAGGATTGTGGGMGTVPDPGTAMGGEWTDVEPNDTPSQAVPVGTILGSAWMGFAQPYTAINPETDVDYFVFRTADAASLDSDYISVCWSFPGNLLDLELYEVVNSMQGPLVASAAQTTAGCETVLDFGQGSTLLKPDTVYLLKVAGAPGLMLNGDPGLYDA